MDSFDTVGKYHHYVRNIVGKSPHVVMHKSNIEIIKSKRDGRRSGVVQTEKILFKDGATIRFTEDIEILLDGNVIERPRYSYEYKVSDKGFWFRYDRDVKRQKSILHEECHLHVKGIYDVNMKPMRFITHATKFGEFFEFVIASFYEKK